MKKHMVAAALLLAGCGGSGNPEYIAEVAKRCGASVSSSDAPAPCAALIGDNRDMLTVFGLTEDGQLKVADASDGTPVTMSREAVIARLQTAEPRVTDP